MKKILFVTAAILLAATALFMLVNAYDVPPVTVTLNGNDVDCASYGQKATIVDDRTLVPLRAIFESLGADIIWDNSSRTVTSVRGTDVIELTIGSNVLMKNKQRVEVDVPARIMNDRTMVPVRVIAESFGVGVDWDNNTRTVILECDESTFPKALNAESELKGKHVYGSFYYGMTMQEAWDAAGENEGEKSIYAFEGGKSEMRISDKEGKYANEDARITGTSNCPLICLLFADDYLYGAYVHSDYSDLETALSVQNTVMECFGKYDEKNIVADKSDERDYEYVWHDGQQEIVCGISEVFDDRDASNVKLANVCELSITDKSVEALLGGNDSKQDAAQNGNTADRENDVPKNNDNDEDKEITDSDKNTDSDDISDDGDDESDDGLTSVDETNSFAVAALEKYLEACRTFNFSLLSECCIDSLGLDRLGIENVRDALEYAGVTKEKLSETMLEKTYRGNEAYVPLTDAVVEVVLEFVSDASNLLYYEINGVVSDNKDGITFEITRYVPDISIMNEIFADSFDKAVRKAFSNGSVSFDMTQKEMMPILSQIAADELSAAFDELLDADSFIPSGKETVLVCMGSRGEWLVKLDEDESEFIKALKKGGNEILELFGFEV